MTRLNWWRRSYAISLFCGIVSTTLLAQTFTVLGNFDGTNGANPEFMSLVQGRNGSFYGTTSHGGYDGVVFRITRRGTLTMLQSFAGNFGCCPLAGLILAANGNFYGVGSGGGSNIYYGTVFRITPKGTLAALYSFCSQPNCADGSSPAAPLVPASDGNFYGTTSDGGSANCAYGCGTIFRITRNGALTTLHTFDYFDGAHPYAGLFQGIDGNLYGTTTTGGAIGNGTIFKMTTSGDFSLLYSFCSQPNCADGISPYSALTQGTDGNFYGTTSAGGTNCLPKGCGTIFKMTPSGTLVTLHSFAGFPSEGAEPYAGLIQATDGNFYGTTNNGGSDTSCIGGCGTIVKITPEGKLTTLHSLSAYTDGAFAEGGLLQATDGNFYGTAGGGGAGGQGTVFRLSTGLGPFVSFVQAWGKVGGTAQILGQGFKGTSVVFFNGIPASYSVQSETFIKATVPPGASTGFVSVTTPSGTLTSNLPFRVIP